ncbi:MAG: MFS transporter [Gammaproteobacteria bacterium]|nr:MAG: MFS transporter [Gammaproteobacteria bacterium]UTW41995.1 MFS transporter [bacterium SCSIO 12844]
MGSVSLSSDRSTNMMTKICRLKGYAWLVILLSAFLLFYKYVMQVFPSLIVSDLKLQFHLTSAETGFFAGIMLYTILVVQLFSGVLLDRFGVRNLSSLSILISAFGVILFAVTKVFYVAVIARILMGVGVAFATVSYLKAASIWFDARRFAFVSSLLATAAMAGAIFGQAPLAYLFANVGWRDGLVICGGVGIVMAVLYWIIVRDDNPNQISSEEYEKDAKATGKLSVKDILAVFKNPNNWLLTIYSGLAFTSIDAFAGLWGNVYLRTFYEGLDKESAAFVISSIFFGMAIGAPCMGKLSEIIDRRLSIMIICNTISSVCLFFALYIHMNYWLLVLSCFLFGFFMSCFMLAFVVGRRVNPIWAVATAVALINSGEPVLGGLFDGLIGKFLDMLEPNVIGMNYKLHSFHLAFIILPISVLIATFLLFFIKEPKKVLN